MCILKGVQSIKSIHGIQALVWGGPIESIAMKDADSTFATVMFFSVEACQKYFEATRNGIRLPGSPERLVSVERVLGPHSVGDILENCITVDATRCVRACHEDGVVFHLVCRVHTEVVHSSSRGRSRDDPTLSRVRVHGHQSPLLPHVQV